MAAGILYKLTFENGKGYIGITSRTLKRRLALHKSHAKKEPRGALQRAIRKYGFESMRVDVLATGSTWEELCKLEKEYISALNTVSPYGYNLTLGGEGKLGLKFTPEQIQRMISSRPCKKGIAPRPAGWQHSEEAKRKISEAGKGRIFSDERKAKIGASKIGNAYCVGKVCSQETRNKIRAAQAGKPRPAGSIEKMIATKRANREARIGL